MALCQLATNQCLFCRLLSTCYNERVSFKKKKFVRWSTTYRRNVWKTVEKICFCLYYYQQWVLVARQRLFFNTKEKKNCFIVLLTKLSSSNVSVIEIWRHFLSVISFTGSHFSLVAKWKVWNLFSYFSIKLCRNKRRQNIKHSVIIYVLHSKIKLYSLYPDIKILKTFDLLKLKLNIHNLSPQSQKFWVTRIKFQVRNVNLHFSCTVGQCFTNW